MAAPMTAKWVQGTPPKYITARVATDEHQGGAEVRLQEYEPRRSQAEAEVAHRALPSPSRVWRRR